MVKEWIVEGFRFQSEDEARAASKEAEGIRYIEGKLNREFPEAILQVYLKLIGDKVFSTPVGLTYLKELQDQLLKSPLIMESEIIPIELPQKAELEETVLKEIKPKGIGNIKNRKTEKTEKTEKRGKTQKTKDKENDKKMNKMNTLFVVNIFLVLTVIAMFVLISTSNVPTIINYKNKIINQYEQWDKELTQRENTIIDKENELKINHKDGN